MHITVITPASAYALPVLEEETPEAFVEHAEWVPTASVGTHWQTLHNEQLTEVLSAWFSGPSFSRSSRRAYAKLNHPVRSVA